MRKQRIAAFLVGVGLLAALPQGAQGLRVEVFQDIAKDAWYYDAVKEGVEIGIFSGVSANRFEPNQVVTRAMFVQTLANYTKNYDGEAVSGHYFDDLASGSWYRKAATWAYGNGLVAGVAERIFDPGGGITREQAVMILHSYALRVGGNGNIMKDRLHDRGINQYEDVLAVSPWAYAAVNWGIEKKIISGVSAKKLSPKGNLTRAQCAQLYQNLRKILGDGPNMLPSAGRENQDPVLPSIQGLRKTFGELAADLPLPKPAGPDSWDPEGYYFEFSNLPGVQYLFPGGANFDHQRGYPAASEKPIRLRGEIKTLLPELAGLYFGDAIRVLEGQLNIRFREQRGTDLWFSAEYWTKEFEFRFTLKGAENIDPETEVFVYHVSG